MGKFGHGEINDNGLRLMSFAAANNFIIGNSHFQQFPKHQLTWRNPSGKNSAILDYILINTRFSSSLKDVWAMRGPDCGSDHYLVRAKVQLQLQWAKRSKMCSPAKMNWACLREPETRQKFQIALSNNASSTEWNVFMYSSDAMKKSIKIMDLIDH